MKPDLILLESLSQKRKNKNFISRLIYMSKMDYKAARLTAQDSKCGSTIFGYLGRCDTYMIAR